MKVNHYIPYNTKLKNKARELRNNMTAAENRLWHYYLRNHRYRFLRQKPIGSYILDFYCSKLKLAIELDGETHIEITDISYDKKRTKFLESYGIKVLRFWNYEVLDNIGAAEEIIEREIRRVEKSPQPPLSRGS